MSVSSPDPSLWFCAIIQSCDYWAEAVLRGARAFVTVEDWPDPFTLATATFTTIATFNISYICLHRKRPMMFLSLGVGFCTAMLLTVAPLSTLAVDQTVDPNLVARLKMAATMNDRLHMLSDQQLLYNFSANPMYSWKPGSVANANAATWPILSTVGVAVAQLNLGPCAMLAPHLHRSNNLVVAVNGTTHTYMVQENGARLVEQVLTPGMMTIFPPASVHSMYNMGCENSQLYSFLDREDPGTLNIAQAFFMMPREVGMQVMPFIGLTSNNWTATAQRIPAIGTGSQAGFEACRRKCGLPTDGYHGGNIAV